MPPTINTDLLRTFMVVAETRHFTGAAQRLNASQSAVSMQIQRLDRLLHIYDATEIGGSAILVYYKVEEDLKAIEKLGLSPEEAELMKQQIAMEAVQSGAMLGFATFAKIRGVSGPIRLKIVRRPIFLRIGMTCLIAGW